MSGLLRPAQSRLPSSPDQENGTQTTACPLTVAPGLPRCKRRAVGMKAALASWSNRWRAVARGRLEMVPVGFGTQARLADGRVVGQIARYLGWVAETLAGDRHVRGIILSHEVNYRLRYAVRPIPAPDPLAANESRHGQLGSATSRTRTHDATRVDTAEEGTTCRAPPTRLLTTEGCRYDAAVVRASGHGYGCGARPHALEACPLPNLATHDVARGLTHTHGS